MYKATIKLKFAKMDQENLYHKVEEWKKTDPDDHFYFRGYGEEIKQMQPDIETEAGQSEGDEIKVIFVMHSTVNKKYLKIMCLNS